MLVLRRTDSVIQFLNQVVFLPILLLLKSSDTCILVLPLFRIPGIQEKNFSMALVLVQRPRLSLHALHAHNDGRKYWNFQKCFNLVNWFQKVFETAQLRVSVQWLKKYFRRKVKIFPLTTFVTKITTFRGVIHTVLNFPGPLACI